MEKAEVFIRDKKALYLETIIKIHKIFFNSKEINPALTEILRVLDNSKILESGFFILLNGDEESNDFILSERVKKEKEFEKMLSEGKLPACIADFRNTDEDFEIIFGEAEKCKDCLLRDSCGSESSVLLKIKFNDMPFGVLKGKIKDEDIGKDEKSLEKEILTGLANDIGFFLHTFKMEKEKNIIKNRFLSLFENSPGCIFFYSLEGRFIDVNNACVEIFGYSSKEELFGINMEKELFVSEEERKRYFDELTKRGKIENYRLNLKKKNGELINIEVTSTLVRNEKGKAVGLLGIISDVTERIKYEDELKKSEEKFRRIFNSLTEIYVRVDLDGRIELVSPSVEKITGYKPEELIGRKAIELYKNKGDREKILKAIYKRGFIKDYELTLKRKDGEFILCSASLSLERDKKGKPLAIEGILVDITERVKREKKLRILALAIEHLDSAFVITDLDANIEYVNRAFEKITGYRKSEVIGKNPRILKSGKHGKGFYREFWNTLTAGKLWRGVFINKKKNGEIYYEGATVFPVLNEEGKIINYGALKKDITEKIKKEKELFYKNRELEKTNTLLKETQSQLIHQEKLASIGVLAAGIAHELNNPIGFISSNLNTLKKYNKTMREFMKTISEELEKRKGRSGEIEEIVNLMKKFKKEKYVDFMLEDVKDLVEESLEGAERISSIVKSLRNFSRVDQIGEFKEYDIREGIENTLVIAKNSYKYVAEIKKDFKDVPPVKCNPNEINQVFLNVIVNAAQAIESEERNGKGIIEIKVYEEDDYVCCSIYDDGPQIPEEIINRIFDPFFTTKEAGKGTGLGLNISYDIVVNKHKGQLLVENCQPKGVKFTIKLPENLRMEGEEE